MTKIHADKQAALTALKEYSQRLQALEEETGVWEEADDSCVEIYRFTRYRDENGEVRKVSR